MASKASTTKLIPINDGGLQLVHEWELIEKWLMREYRMTKPVASIISKHHQLGGSMINLVPPNFK